MLVRACLQTLDPWGHPSSAGGSQHDDAWVGSAFWAEKEQEQAPANPVPVNVSSTSAQTSCLPAAQPQQALRKRTSVQQYDVLSCLCRGPRPVRGLRLAQRVAPSQRAARPQPQPPQAQPRGPAHTHQQTPKHPRLLLHLPRLGHPARASRCSHFQSMFPPRLCQRPPRPQPHHSNSKLPTSLLQRHRELLCLETRHVGARAQQGNEPALRLMHRYVCLYMCTGPHHTARSAHKSASLTIPWLPSAFRLPACQVC